MISNVLSRSKTSDSENVKETKLRLCHWVRLGVTWWLQCDKGALLECPSQREYGHRLGVTPQHIRVSFPFPMTSLSSFSPFALPFLLPYSHLLDFRPTRLINDSQSGWEGALLSLQAEPTSGSLSHSQVMGRNWEWVWTKIRALLIVMKLMMVIQEGIGGG